MAQDSIQMTSTPPPTPTEYLLTDPSGKSNATYWNDFFQNITRGKSFEWYTPPEEIHRLLQLFLSDEQCSHYQNKNDWKLMFHPGSGNSQLPVYLRDAYPSSFHVVLDCSDIAIKEMMTQHGDSGRRVDYIIGDVLATESLPFCNDTFDIWLDKGLIDALFCDANQKSKEECHRLFQESQRVTQEGGIIIVVTLAQDHTLQLLLDGVENHNWGRVLIYEVDPLPGSTSPLRPFVFVYVADESLENSSIVFHKRSGESISIPLTQTKLSNGNIEGEEASLQSSNLFHSVLKILQTSRKEFLSQIKMNQSKRVDLVTLQIKPYDMETDLNHIKGNLINLANAFAALTWKEFAIVPMAFGLSKLIAKCCVVIESDGSLDVVETLVEKIREQEEGVQSVDVESIIPLADPRSIAQCLTSG